MGTLIRMTLDDKSFVLKIIKSSQNNNANISSRFLQVLQDIHIAVYRCYTMPFWRSAVNVWIFRWPGVQSGVSVWDPFYTEISS